MRPLISVLSVIYLEMKELSEIHSDITAISLYDDFRRYVRAMLGNVVGGGRNVSPAVYGLCKLAFTTGERVSVDINGKKELCQLRAWNPVYNGAILYFLRENSEELHLSSMWTDLGETFRQGGIFQLDEACTNRPEGMNEVECAAREIAALALKVEALEKALKEEKERAEKEGAEKEVLEKALKKERAEKKAWRKL
jgi:hypothetical protein